MTDGTADRKDLQPASARIWLSWIADALVLRRRALRLTRGNREEAEDLLSATLVKAVTHVERHQTEVREPRAFLLFAMKNEHISRIRRLCSERQVRDFKADIHEPYGVDLSDHQPGQEEKLKHREALARVLDQVGMMTPELRQVFQMRFCEERSYKDIAASLGISEPLARKRVQHLRQSLKTAIAETDPSAMSRSCRLSQASG
ncbi:RNA polymerase sigma factor [Roseibium sp. RKSG952]|uniref:RNA polymerase sigma factor n=1 Tax=Roseibium sp. RKSG952 TaxID=2529384 RepID=UPI0012BC42DD|nr:sigma-70 family RNA polymerase sigma factor [Roseibium sp. RKSG952]MTH95140.1 sigma-70 family RNA polymerase sigma factor [Roseibium sp. RKSG952]